MDRNSFDVTSLKQYFFPAAAACIALFTVVSILILRPDQAPEDAVELYVTSLANGRCRKAYSMVTPFAKEYDVSYRTFDDFNKNVCEKIESNYEDIFVYRIDDVVPDAEGVSVHFRLRFRTRWAPAKQDRPAFFKMRKKGRKWLIDGPTLEI